MFFLWESNFIDLNKIYSANFTMQNHLFPYHVPNPVALNVFKLLFSIFVLITAFPKCQCISNITSTSNYVHLKHWCYRKPSVAQRLAVSITATSKTHLLLLTFSAQLENGLLKGFVFAPDQRHQGSECVISCQKPTELTHSTDENVCHIYLYYLLYFSWFGN